MLVSRSETPTLESPHIMPPPSERVAAYRDKYRAEDIGPHYNGRAHLAFVIIASLATIIGPCFLVRAPISFADWMAIPSALLLANIIEYLGHRGPMHHRRSGAGLMFQRHTEEHHAFFSENAMTCRSPRDFKIVLFPPVMLFFYLGAITLPIAIVTYFVTTLNAACFVISSAMFYFPSYEVLHFSYHMDEDTFIGRLWMIRVLREHHRAHHNPNLMQRYNFNITWPLSDYLFGTVYRPGRSDDESSQ